jgi:hypothetical protein
MSSLKNRQIDKEIMTDPKTAPNLSALLEVLPKVENS